MNVGRDRSPIWIGIADLLLCVVSVVIVAVVPVHAKTDGVKNARQLISADWPVALDSDVDLWVVGPSHKPTFYGSRSNGCAALDRDTRGYSTSLITLQDGSVVQQESNKETTSLRCIEPGRWDVGVNLYSDRELDKGAKSIKVHVEVNDLNPIVHTLFSGNVELKKVGQTINVVSFEMAQDGSIKLVDPPLAPVTDQFRKAEP